ncbi:MAG: DUF2225 domain-containing protein [Lachnospiraceae bacterium]|nr:DUF2225 domain-containing protein [Lachnospiraceae bacterium]
MAGLLDGLGLKNLEGMELFEEKKKEEAPEKAKAPVIQETDYLFDKSYECPVCYEKIKARTVKAGKARLIKSDMDLRPVYEHIEPLKYDVILCPHCGYTALSRYFGGLTASQIKDIKENISKSFRATEEPKDAFSYDYAIYLYKMSLANALVKHAKASEKAYICLKAGWLCRSYAENLDKGTADYEKKFKELKQQEKEFHKNALEGFLTAREKENYPMCGMDEATVEYLVAVLAMEFDQLDVSARIISNLIVSPSANSRMKDKARDIKELLVAKMKEKK